MLYGLDLTTLADADTKLHCNAKPMRKPLAGRRGRSQWCDASARCGSKRYLCEECSAAWTASSAQRGVRRTREDCHHGEREAVSEGNVAENMTVPRKAMGKSPRLQSHGCDNVGLHGNGHTFRFTNHNNSKGVAERQL